MVHEFEIVFGMGASGLVIEGEDIPVRREFDLYHRDTSEKVNGCWCLAEVMTGPKKGTIYTVKHSKKNRPFKAVPPLNTPLIAVMRIPATGYKD